MQLINEIKCKSIEKKNATRIIDCVNSSVLYLKCDWLSGTWQIVKCLLFSYLFAHTLTTKYSPLEQNRNQISDKDSSTEWLSRQMMKVQYFFQTFENQFSSMDVITCLNFLCWKWSLSNFGLFVENKIISERRSLDFFCFSNFLSLMHAFNFTSAHLIIFFFFL